MSHQRDRLDLLAIAIMTGICALWGLNQVTVKIANSGISPVAQAGLRSAGAALLLWAWARWRGVPLFRRDGTLWVGIAAALLFSAEFAVLYWGLEYTAASRAVIFLYMAPFFVAIGAHCFIPGEKVRGVQVLGLLAAFIGVGVAFAEALQLPSAQELTGDLMAFAAAIFWAATIVLVKASGLSRISPEKTLFYQLAGSGILLIVLSLALDEPGIFAPRPLVLACFFFQVVIVAFASYLCWFWLIKHYPAFRLSAFSFLTPVFGLLAGAVLLGEPVTPAVVAALVLVGGGIYLVNQAAPAVAHPASAAVLNSAD